MLSFQTGPQAEFILFWGWGYVNYHPLPHSSLAALLPSARWTDRKGRWLWNTQICPRKKVFAGAPQQTGQCGLAGSRCITEWGWRQSVHFSINLMACHRVQIKHGFMSVHNRDHRGPSTFLSSWQGPLLTLGRSRDWAPAWQVHAGNLISIQLTQHWGFISFNELTLQKRQGWCYSYWVWISCLHLCPSEEPSSSFIFLSPPRCGSLKLL